MNMVIGSKGWKAYDCIRDRIVEDRLCKMIAGKHHRRRVCRVYEGRLLHGWASGHRRPDARRWRTCLRIKRRLHPLRVE